MTKRLAIFDCDGTLVDSQANICIAMEHAFGDAGMDAPPGSVVVVPLGPRQIIGVVWDEGDLPGDQYPEHKLRSVLERLALDFALAADGKTAMIASGSPA